MTTELKDIVKEIDSLIRKEMWYDFHVFSYDGEKLIIAGSIDLIYYHTLEVIFEDVFFVSGYFNTWHTDTSKAVFMLPENKIEMNIQYEIEVGYNLFIFKTEDYKNDIVIAAQKVYYNTDTVFYYDRQDLKPNERIAHFVKK